MKAEIHPDYINCEVVCACGSKFMTRSTKPSIHLEICGACHPFYTGKQKFVDTAGRIQRFQEKFRWDQDAAKKTVEAKPQKAKKEAPAEE